MPNIPLQPFAAAQQAAEALTDPRTKSQLLTELAQRQLSTGHFDDALQTFAVIPIPLERRIALLVADFQSFPPEKADALLQLLKAERQTKFLAGRLAIAMLETNNTRTAWKLVESDRDAFETEQQEYEFFAKALPLADSDGWEQVLRAHTAFLPGMYKDWASLALVKHLTGQQQPEKAEEFIALLSTPILRVWAYWVVYRLFSTEHAFDKALEAVNEVKIDSNLEEAMETLAIVLRIFGRAAFEKGKRDQGEQLLERSEAAAATLTLPIQRYRLQCFLGKVLRELGLIGSIREYLPIDDMLRSLTSALNRSRVLVWLAEAGWSKGWTRAVEVMATPERGMEESERVGQITEVLQRFVAQHQGLEAVGDSVEDAVRLSGEAFESLYFDPFAVWDCEC